ncbi:MAG: hypothetical protein HY401_00240 [Elusimicrobia bacterium]|nr:hypothetical protein [Elusimicrobiota bacterium]
MKSSVFKAGLEHIVVLLFFGVLTILAQYPLIFHLNEVTMGEIKAGDELVFVWNSWFFQHQISQGQNPLWNDLHFWPAGYNMIFHNYALMHCLVVYFIGPLVGFLAALNLSVLICPLLGAYGAFLMARELGCGFKTALFAGYIASFNAYAVALPKGGSEYPGYWPIIFFAWRYYKAQQDPTGRNLFLAALFLFWTWLYTPYYQIFCLFFLGAMTFIPHIELAVLNFDANRPWIRRARYLGLAAFLGGAAWLYYDLTAWGQIAFEGSGGFRDILRYVFPYWLTLGSALVFFILWRGGLPYGRWRPQESLFDIFFPMVSTLFWWGLIIAPTVAVIAVLSYHGIHIESPGRWRGGGTTFDLANFFQPNLGHPLWASFFRGTSLWDTGWIYGLGWSLPLLLIWYFRKYFLPQARLWLALGLCSVVLELGSYFKFFGFNTYFPMPFYFLHQLPFFSNLKGTARLAVANYFFFGIALALACERYKEKIRIGFFSASFLTIAWSVFAFEHLFNIPRPLRPWSVPAIYERFKPAPAGAALTVPFSASFRYARTPYRDERQYLVNQIVHQHPLVAGFAGGMPKYVFELYRDDPFLFQLNLAQETGRLSQHMIEGPLVRQGLRRWGVKYIIVEKNRTPPALFERIERFWPVTLRDHEEDIYIFDVLLDRD